MHLALTAPAVPKQTLETWVPNATLPWAGLGRPLSLSRLMPTCPSTNAPMAYWSCDVPGLSRLWRRTRWCQG